MSELMSAGVATMPGKDAAARPPATGARRFSLQRAIWRWHFYAGLLSIPFLMIFSITGGLYLFKDEINRTVFAHRFVVAPEGARLAPGILTARAAEAVPGGAAAAYVDPAGPTSAAVVAVRDGSGKKFVYLDPYKGTVLDVVRAEREPMWVLKKIHSLEFLGVVPNRVMEAVGGFAVILIATGIYLWWPRNGSGGAVRLRGRPRQRVWWRDLHAVTGLFAGAVVLFLAVTGLPWSGFFGSKLNQYATEAGIGYPTKLWDEVPSSTVPVKAVLETPGWTVEDAPVPLSTPAASSPIGLDRAVDIARGLGMTPGFEVALPASSTGVYTAAIFPDDLSLQRTIHLDQHTGSPLVDLPFASYGALGKAIEFGINVHQGQQWGLANQLVMLAGCIAVVLLCVTGAAMWWKRRPAGKVGVPPMPEDARVYRALWVVAIAVGIALPMTGLAILIMVGLDALVIRTVPPLRHAFG